MEELGGPLGLLEQLVAQSDGFASGKSSRQFTTKCEFICILPDFAAKIRLVYAVAPIDCIR